MEEHDLAVRGLLGRARSGREPGAKRLPGKRWQRTLRRNAEAFLGPLAEGAACQPIGQGRGHLPQAIHAWQYARTASPVRACHAWRNNGSKIRT